MVNLTKFKQPEVEAPKVEKQVTVRHTAQELKQFFLDNAQPLVKQYIDAALGNAELKSTNMSAREEVWGVLKQLMLSSSDKLDIDINSAQDVLDAVSKGKCTFEEASKLLEMYKKMKEIENVGLAPGSVAQGFTINILGSQKVEPQQTKVIEHE